MGADDVPASLVGYRVVSGTGEELGTVTGILVGADGQPRKIAFVETGDAQPRFVPLRFIRAIGEGAVRLAGPREGYHITRVRTMREPDDEGEG